MRRIRSVDAIPKGPVRRATPVLGKAPLCQRAHRGPRITTGRDGAVAPHEDVGHRLIARVMIGPRGAAVATRLGKQRWSGQRHLQLRGGLSDGEQHLVRARLVAKQGIAFHVRIDRDEVHQVKRSHPQVGERPYDGNDLGDVQRRQHDVGPQLRGGLALPIAAALCATASRTVAALSPRLRIRQTASAKPSNETCKCDMRLPRQLGDHFVGEMLPVGGEGHRGDRGDAVQQGDGLSIDQDLRRR